MTLQNMSIAIGYKGAGSVNGIPAYNDQGAWLLGGFQNLTDTQVATFGCVMSINPAAGVPGSFFCGIPSGYKPVGILIYHAGIAMNDPSKPDSFINGQPLTVMYEGTLWLSTWASPSPFKAVPRVTDKVVVNNTTGLISFLDVGSSVPTGYTALDARVVSVSQDTSGVELFVNIV